MRFLKYLSLFLVFHLLTGCGKEQALSRIPDMPVNIQVPVGSDLNTILSAKSITSTEGYPADTKLGFGGILLVNGFATDSDNNAFYAFDLACPHEANSQIRIRGDKVKLDAYCPQCQSRFEVFHGSGVPTAGVARDNKTGLKRYRTQLQGNYVRVTR